MSSHFGGVYGPGVADEGILVLGAAWPPINAAKVHYSSMLSETTIEEDDDPARGGRRGSRVRKLRYSL